ncbi:hypothetical protein [Rickettsia endosymbiont of Halotydeus destructor]|uniref:hypothetical protein n=1 Tax=Rickettsia endosymbiont of Halotydeus destructor TaxID=2996754 RepID=UPI003BAF8FCC
MKQEIIRKALVLLGSNSSSYSNVQSGNSISKAENLCEEFVEPATEEALLSVKWDFALKRVNKIDAETSGFKEIPNISDCIKLAVIVPSNLGRKDLL